MNNYEEDNFKSKARLLRVLGHPVRLALLSELAQGQKCVTDIRDILKVRQPNVSQHLAVLRKAGLVDYQEDGNLRCYYILRPALVRDLLHLVTSDTRKNRNLRPLVGRQAPKERGQNPRSCRNK